MSSRRLSRGQLSRLAWLVWLLCMALAGLSMIQRVANYPLLRDKMGLSGTDLFFDILLWGVLFPSSVPAYATVGALVATHYPRNSIGWLALSLSMVTAFGDLVWQYAARANWAGFPLPGAGAANWLAGWTGLLIFSPLPLALMLLVFPSGRLLSRSWWLVVATGVGGLLSLTAASALQPEVFHGIAGRTPSLVTLTTPPAFRGFPQGLFSVGMLVSLFTLVIAMASVRLRWQRSHGVERQQIKWLSVVTAYVAVSMALFTLFRMAGVGSSLQQAVLTLAMMGATVGIPVAVGVAMLKYQLYHIDQIIEHTVVYGALSLTLLAIYLVIVFSLQFALRVIAGGESGFAVMVSTLVIAVLFGPLHDRIQRVMDRSFFRSKYDAERIIEHFGAQLRTEVDLDRLTARLIAIVYETAQPSQVSLWLVNHSAAGSESRQEQP